MEQNLSLNYNSTKFLDDETKINLQDMLVKQIAVMTVGMTPMQMLIIFCMLYNQILR